MKKQKEEAKIQVAKKIQQTKLKVQHLHNLQALAQAHQEVELLRVQNNI